MCASVKFVLFGIGVTLFAAVVILATASADETPLLRILTYNIHHGEGTDGEIDLERIAAIIQSIEPDVVCLQEVDRNLPRTNHLDMPARFAELLEMDVVFDANYRFDGGEYGNATLTRLPIVAYKNVRLPGPDGVEPRGCLRVDIEWQGEIVSVFNTHWGLKPEERVEQAKATAKLLGDRPHPVLAGDLNATPESEPLAIVTEHVVDSAARLHPADSAELNTVRNRRIDYVLGLRPVAGEVIRNDATKVASDHLPYYADLALPSQD
jgi:endonuclease/exonuclease/phosphatase family metal-dependent hydrolase